ncbi:hypothetical protein KIPB_007553 [Kipferlia bialata]|uniref:Uncharacterized protein n=1 Tax=Kipferlia bialata TaxID=797122 RepID=A0A9K3D1X8_9EUKA|nr:hypothetical protein KIPB_007553 [Kipferlia bialata]|eukprot:g7553.t1
MARKLKTVKKSTSQLKKEGAKSRADVEAPNNSLAEMLPMNMMMEMGLRRMGVAMAPYPDTLREMEGRHPEGWDRTKLRNHLRLCHESSRLLPYSMEMLMRQGRWPIDPTDLMKRLNGNWNLDWYLEAKIGDVCTKSPSMPQSYNAYTRHNFSNQVYPCDVMYWGTSHVAVGFVDLGPLLMAEIRTVGGEEERETDPLTYVGYELSAYAVAKSSVIWHLLQTAPEGEEGERERVRRVLQVWYSATWERETESLFRASVSALLAPSLSPSNTSSSSGSSSAAMHPEVRAILEHWASPSLSPSLSLSQARRAWYETHESTAEHLSGCLKRRQDRVAVGMYHLTGDFTVATPLVKSKSKTGKGKGKGKGSSSTSTTSPSLVGSLAMYSTPDGTAPCDEGETVFSVVSIGDVVGATKPGETLMDGIERYLSHRVCALMHLAREGRVKVSLRVGDVLTPALGDEVRETLSPRTMTWSNVIDYVTPSVFHMAAHRVGGDTCTHYGYSMNWVTLLKGAHLMDYMGYDNGRGPLLSTVLNLANQTGGALNKFLGLSPYLRSPPPVHPFNNTSILLQHIFYRYWVELFRQRVVEEGRGGWTAAYKMGQCPLSRTGESAVYLQWGYGREASVSHFWGTSTAEKTEAAIVPLRRRWLSLWHL